MLKLIPQFVQIVMFFMNLYREKDKEKAQAKKVVADRITDALKQTDPERRAALLNNAIGRIKRLR
jgi:hypothetical protein